MFITVFTRVGHLSLSSATRIQAPPTSHRIHLRSVLSLFSHLRLGLKSVFFLQVCPPKPSVDFCCPPPIRATCPVGSILDLMVLALPGEQFTQWSCCYRNLVHRYEQQAAAAQLWMFKYYIIMKTRQLLWFGRHNLRLLMNKLIMFTIKRYVIRELPWGVTSRYRTVITVLWKGSFTVVFV